MAHLGEKEGASNFWIAMCIAGSLVCLSLYFRDLESASLLGSRGKKIGFVQEMDQDVQRRPNDRMLWVSVLPRRPIFEFDTIKTGPESSALISLNENQGSFRVSPNSLVVLDTTQNGLEVRLASGDLFLKGHIKAKVGDRLVTASTDSEVKIARRTEVGALDIEIHQGQASVEGLDGTKTQLKSGAQFSEQKGAAPTISTFPVKILSPESATTRRLKDGEKLRFDFEGLDVAKKFQLELCKSPEFGRQVLKFPIGAKVTEIALSPGSWYARLVDISTHRPQSTVSQFLVKAQPKLEWNTVKDGEFSATLKNQKTEFSLEWKKIEEAVSYELVMSRGEEILFKNALNVNHFDANTVGDSFFEKLPQLSGWQENPSLELKLTATDINGRTLGESIQGRLRFTDGRISPAPEQVKLTIDPADFRQALLSWSHGPTSDQISFEVRWAGQSRSFNGSQAVLAASELFKSLTNEIEIRSYGKNGSSSGWVKLSYDRAPFEFASLVSEKSNLVYPTSGSRILKNTVSQTSVEWKLPKSEFIELENVEVKIENKSKNTKALVLKSKSNRLQLPNLAPGDYAISVQPYWKKYGPSAPSEARDFSVIKGAGLRAPQLRRPAGVE